MSFYLYGGGMVAQTKSAQKVTCRAITYHLIIAQGLLGARRLNDTVFILDYCDVYTIVLSVLLSWVFITLYL